MTGSFAAHFVLIFCAVCATYPPSKAEPPKVTPTEARQLVSVALSDKIKRLPGFDLLTTDLPEDVQKCLTFDVIWANAGEGSVHVGFWAVDMRTAEVWEPTLCERVTNKSLRNLQRSIRKRLGVTDAEYRMALKHSPCCTPDPYSK